MMAVTDDPAALDLVTAGHQLRSGGLTSVALTEACRRSGAGKLLVAGREDGVDCR